MVSSNKLINFLNLTKYHEKLKNILITKQENITDLDDIRSGAALGATALQENEILMATNDDIDALFSFNKFPSNGILYTIKSIEGKLIYVDGDNKPLVGDEEENNSKFVWLFENVGNGIYYIKNLHTQSYISDVSLNEQIIMGETPLPLYIEVVDELQGIVSITTTNGYSLYMQSDGKLVGYTTNEESKIVWYLEKKEEDTINFTVTINANTNGNDTKSYSTLCLTYNTIIPEGVTVSIINGVDDNNLAIMENIEGGILPANTAVLVSGEESGTVQFKYTSQQSNFDCRNNILKGTNCNKLIYCGDEYNIYMLSRSAGRVAFYWTYENRGADGNYVYINANEEIVESTAVGAHKNHNKGGYVKCNANKAYMLREENNENGKNIWIN
jgi:hypothetical protein